MPVVDYEAAWIELLDLVVSRPGWGSSTLAAEAASIAARHRVPESLVERVMRLYGEDVMNPGKTIPTDGGTPTAPRIVAPTNEARGVHDGSQRSIEDHHRRHARR